MKSMAIIRWLWHRITHPLHDMPWNDEYGDMGCLTCSTCYWMRVLDED